MTILGGLCADSHYRRYCESQKIEESTNLAKIWLLCSSHCSPLDYFVLGVAKLDVNKSAPGQFQLPGPQDDGDDGQP